MPNWSKSSRAPDYFGKNILQLKVTNSSGQHLYYEKINENIWEIDWDKGDFNSSDEAIEVEYLAYCYSNSLKGAYIDEFKASLNGAAIFMGIEEFNPKEIEISIVFPGLWSRLNTNLKDISSKRQEFIYRADNFEQLFGSLFEIGCHETDGFQVAGVDHYLAEMGGNLSKEFSFKEDFKKIVDGVYKVFKKLPYTNYFFCAIFEEGKTEIRSGQNFSCLKFDGIFYSTPFGRTQWIIDCTRAYLQSWIGNEIFPEGSLPWDYIKGNQTKQLWHFEGILSFLGLYLPYKCELLSNEDFNQLVNFEFRKFAFKQGDHFQTLDERSLEYHPFKEGELDQWGKVDLERKSLFIFFLAHLYLRKKGKGLEDILVELINIGGKNNGQYSLEDLLNLFETYGGKELREKIENWAFTNEEMNIFHYLKELGFQIEIKNVKRKWPFMGANFFFLEGRVFIKNTILDGPAFKAGLNNGDEVIAINGLRVLGAEIKQFLKGLNADTYYRLTISRRGQLKEIPVFIENSQIPLFELSKSGEVKLKKLFLG